MVKRRAIGASTASAVIFSVVLLSNLAMFAASQDRASLYDTAEVEASLSDTALALTASVAVNLLTSLQSFLASTTMACSDVMGAVSSYVPTIIDREEAGGVAVTASARMTGGALGDNLSLLRPFNGSVPGMLDLLARFDSQGGSGSSGVWLDRTESHALHLPVMLDGGASACAEAVGLASESASATAMPNCTSTAIDSWLSSTTSSLRDAAQTDGFVLSTAVDGLASSPCSVSYLILAVGTFEGVSGTVSVRFEESGNATFAQPAPSPQA